MAFPYVTALAGVIAKHYGPVIGGLFFAFPAIFPASATLIEKTRNRRSSGLVLTAHGVAAKPLL